MGSKYVLKSRDYSNQILSSMESILSHSGSVLGLLKLLLGLAELGQVEGSDLLSLLNLLLVGLDLRLELGGKVGHAVLVLSVLIILELEFLDLALSSLVRLHVLSSLGLDIAKLNLEFTDASLELGHGRLATTHGSVIGISKTVLKFSKLGLKSSLALTEAGGVVLLRSELISKSGGINHGLLGLLLGVLGLVQEVVNLSLHSVERSLNTSLVSRSSGVDGVHLIDSIASITKLSLSLSLASLSRVKESSGLLDLSLESIGTSVREAGLLRHLLAETTGLLVLALGLTELSLVSLDGLESLVVGLVGVVQGDLKLVDVRLKLLLDCQTLSLGTLLRLQGSLERLHGTSVVLASVVEFLFLLSNSSVNLLLNLSKLKLGSENLVLLGLKSTLSFLKSSLELLLLSLKSTALFVKFMDGASTITKLVKKILDFISEVLVLTTDNVKLLIGFIKSSLETESLSVEVAALRVAGVQFGHQVVSLGLPLTNNLVKVAATLLGDHGGGVGALVLHTQLLQLSVHSGLGLLSGGNLGVEVLNVFLSLLDTRGQLGLATLELINTAKSFNFILGFPELDLRLSLGQCLESIILLLILLVNAHAEILSLSHQALVLGEQSSTVSGLTISQSLGVLQLGGQRDLVLLEGGDGILALLNLSGQVLGLNLELLLGGISFIESSGKLIKLAISLNNHALAHLDILLHVGSLSHGLLKTRFGLSKISLHTSLVLLRLGLLLVDGVNLLTQLAHAVVVLLSQSSQSSLMGNVGLFQVRLELGKFSFALLVQLHLESSVGASLLQPGANVLQVTGEKSSVLLSLGTVSTLNIDLLVKLINTDLEFLDLLGVFRGQGLLVLNLGSNGGNLLLLALDSLSKLRDDSLQIRNSFLGKLEVSFNLSLHLLSISLGLLLSLKSILALIKRLFKLALDLAEVVASVLHGLDVLLSLLSALSSGLLVLAKLGDQTSW